MTNTSQAAREAAEDVVSVANITTCDGYYEIDLDAAADVIARFEQKIRAEYTADAEPVCPVHASPPDTAAQLAEARAENERLRGHMKFLADLPKTHIHESNGPDRVRVGDEWHEGPLATAYLKLVRLLGEVGSAALAPKGEGE